MTKTMGDKFSLVSINGQILDNPDAASISIWDTSFHRGDGVFEVLKIVGNGKIRSLKQHLVRLRTSAVAVGCPLPSDETLSEWLQMVATQCANKGGYLRLIATKGNSNYDSAPSQVIINWFVGTKWPKTFTLLPLLAPWHVAGAPGWETPIKWTSYGPNVVSSSKAKAEGHSDALLLTGDRLACSASKLIIDDCHVLDGPNFAIGWISGNTLHVPCCETLGLLPSITQGIIVDLARSKLSLEVQQGVYTLKDLLSTGEEVFVMSTTRGIIPVTRIGNTELPQKSHEYVTKLKLLLEAVE